MFAAGVPLLLLLAGVVRSRLDCVLRLGEELRIVRDEMVRELTGTERAHLRDQFLLQPDVVYLNHGSCGACARPVFEAYQARHLELERQPMAFARRLSEQMRQAREALGGFVGADAGDLAYMTNATMGLNIVARSLPLEPGDEVLATDHEYGALDRVWQFNCKKRGARYVRQPIPLPADSVEQVVEAVCDPVHARARLAECATFMSRVGPLRPSRAL